MSIIEDASRYVMSLCCDAVVPPGLGCKIRIDVQAASRDLCNKLIFDAGWRLYLDRHVCPICLNRAMKNGGIEKVCWGKLRALTDPQGWNRLKEETFHRLVKEMG